MVKRHGFILLAYIFYVVTWQWFYYGNGVVISKLCPTRLGQQALVRKLKSDKRVKSWRVTTFRLDPDGIQPKLIALFDSEGRIRP